MSVRSDSHESFDKITAVEEEMPLLESFDEITVFEEKMLDNTMRIPPTLIVTPPPPTCQENSELRVFKEEKRKNRPDQERYERESDLDSRWNNSSRRQSGMSLIHTTMRYKHRGLCFPRIFLTIY